VVIKHKIKKNKVNKNKNQILSYLVFFFIYIVKILIKINKNVKKTQKEKSFLNAMANGRTISPWYAIFR
jgi:hypothetical protein